MIKAISQESEVLKHLQSGKSLSSIEAINLFGATRLSAIIYSLKHKGHNIVTNKKITKNRYGHSTQYAEYVLIP